MAGSTAQTLKDMFHILLYHFGPQHWWPGETELEIIVGAVLTQNTNWTNVEKAIGNLKKRDLLTVNALEAIPVASLAEAVRPAGFFNLKAKRLKNVIDFIMLRYGGDLSMLLKEETSTLREGLLSVRGIGRETADSILLYAARAPVFVVDAYTHRILHRHAMADELATYEEMQALFMENLPEDHQLFNELHALIVRTGKEYCRKNPRCNICPLKEWGPITPGLCI